MTTPKLDTFRTMVAKHPANALARFGLANELLKAELFEEATVELRAYLGMYEDEGNAFGRLAEALIKLGREDEARDALTTGIETATRHGHAGLAGELEARLDELDV
ncbi:MAG: tetratricopeptide repeat protein [Gemmatimonadaceae bacterium]